MSAMELTGNETGYLEPVLIHKVSGMILGQLVGKSDTELRTQTRHKIRTRANIMRR